MALSSEQTALIQAGAAAVPPRWRPRFLAQVAEQLPPHSHPSNDDVFNATRAARRALACGISPPSLD
jgi:hypothetical protein